MCRWTACSDKDKAVGSSYTWWALGCGAFLWWTSGRRLKALRH